MISPLQWLLTMGQSKTRHANKSIIDGCVSQMVLLLMMNNGILMASEDRSDIVFSCVLTDELAHCALTNSFKPVISQMALLK